MANSTRANITFWYGCCLTNNFFSWKTKSHVKPLKSSTVDGTTKIKTFHFPLTCSDLDSLAK